MLNLTRRLWIGSVLITTAILFTGCGANKTVEKGKDDTVKKIDTNLAPGQPQAGGPDPKKSDTQGGPGKKKN